jgi:hypothetical protein
MEGEMKVLRQPPKYPPVTIAEQTEVLGGWLQAVLSEVSKLTATVETLQVEVKALREELEEGRS